MKHGIYLPVVDPVRKVYPGGGGLSILNVEGWYALARGVDCW